MSQVAAHPEVRRLLMEGAGEVPVPAAVLRYIPYIGAWTKTFTKFATEAGIKVTNLNSNYDAAVQSQQIDDAIAQKFDLIVLCYVNDQAVVPALTRVKAAGIPVVLMVTPLKKDYEELFTSYVGTDHHELGRLAGGNVETSQRMVDTLLRALAKDPSDRFATMADLRDALLATREASGVFVRAELDK